MTPLEKIRSMKIPFAELKGVTFIEADKDRVVAKMLVRPDLCTVSHSIHGGAVMAFADSVGAAATVINLPEDAKGTTTIRARPISLAVPKREPPSLPRRHPFIGGDAHRSGKPGWKPRRENSSRSSRRPRWFSEWRELRVD